jgi:D-sedoheptulose 7-phosphate isomerase
MSTEPTGFLYPFIEAEERHADVLISDLAASARAKLAESHRLRTTAVQDCATIIAAAGERMADRFRHGGRLFTFGNGGSATDAEGTVDLFRAPPAGRALPALSLVEDRAVLTALANDVGYELVFSRQLIAHAHPGDMVMGFSTSGGSLNVIRAFEEASRRGVLTVGLCGYEGGAMASCGALEYCLVVRSDSVHRIQEAQDAVTLALWQAVQEALGNGYGP